VSRESERLSVATATNSVDVVCVMCYGSRSSEKSVVNELEQKIKILDDALKQNVMLLNASENARKKQIDEQVNVNRLALAFCEVTEHVNLFVDIIVIPEIQFTTDSD